MKKNFLKSLSFSLLLSVLAFSTQINSLQADSYLYQPASFDCHSNENQKASLYEDQLYRERLHKNAFHHLSAFTDNNEVILLDSSIWTIEPGSRSTVASWVKDDEIFIKPYKSWFFSSNYKYELFNSTLQQSVKANLISPGVYTLIITKINDHDRLIQLSDNTIWTFELDYAFATYWQKGQRVIVGTNHDWHYNTKSPQILINADLINRPYCLVNHLGVAL